MRSWCRILAARFDLWWSVQLARATRGLLAGVPAADRIPVDPMSCCPLCEARFRAGRPVIHKRCGVGIERAVLRFLARRGGVPDVMHAWARTLPR